MIKDRRRSSRRVPSALVAAAVGLASAIAFGTQPLRADTVQAAGSDGAAARPVAAVVSKARSVVPSRYWRPATLTLAQPVRINGLCARPWCEDRFTLILGIGY